ncbi:MAG: xanthine dehydrogenase family protein molybdopterin-binding subunit [Candidatus Caldarchaeum sp.]|nr:xanthine dehydrogenase family protein molybdopterin-binding subunit [Candidatus Caldarchaeum sp.]
MPTQRRWIGERVKRLEDPPLLTGKATFVDDLKINGMLHAAILRSPYPHAYVRGVEVKQALKRPGVRAVLLPSDVLERTKPIPPARQILHLSPQEYCMAVGKTRYVGEPVAAVAAETQAEAFDALEDIHIEYAPLESVSDPYRAMNDSSNLVYEPFGTNLAAHFHEKWGNVEAAFASADRVLEMEFKLHSYSIPPLETIGVLAKYDEHSKGLTVWANVQMVGEAVKVLSHCLGIPSNRLRLVVPHIGGGFGLKGRPWKNLLITSLLSLKTGRPVKYVETRREHLSSAGHTPACFFKIKAAVRKDGRILGYRIEEVVDEGASISYAGIYALMHKTLINGAYDVRNIEWDAYCVLTNKSPSTPVRAVGKAGIGYVVERMVDTIARELSMDPAEIRFKNYIKAGDMPYATPSGKIYDPSDYSAILRKALEVARVEEYRQSRREDGKVYGVGISTVVHGGSAWAVEFEAIQVSVDVHGCVKVSSPSPDMGTGQRTSLAQIVAEELGITPQSVSFPENYFDSQSMVWTPFSGTHASKFSGPDVESCVRAARILKSKVLKAASLMLEANPNDLVLEDGMVGVRNSGVKVSLEQVAAFVYRHQSNLPEGLEPGLTATWIGGSDRSRESYVEDPTASYLTYPFSAHVAVVALDPETGYVEVEKYVVVHDCGATINPMIVEGQVVGSVANGVEAALLCEFVYDADSQMLTQTFADLLLMTASEGFDVSVYDLSHPTNRSILGVKGIAEADVIGPLAAVPNAVLDALSNLGINAQIDSLPLTPEKILTLITPKMG